MTDRVTTDTLVAGGTLVTASETIDADLAIDDGQIAGIGTPETLQPADRVIDATGKLVMPEVVDPHVHIGDVFSIDSYETATRAAALGGVTTVVDFGWQAWTGETSPHDREGTLSEGIEHKRELAETAIVDYGLHGAITREDPAVFDEIAALADGGVTSFKLFTTYDVGVSNGFLDRVFEVIGDHDCVAVVHTEDDSVCEAATDRCREDGRGEPTAYPDSRPGYAEAMAAENAVRLRPVRDPRADGTAAQDRRRRRRDVPTPAGRHARCRFYGPLWIHARDETGRELVGQRVRSERAPDCPPRVLRRGDQRTGVSVHVSRRKEVYESGATVRTDREGHAVSGDGCRYRGLRPVP